MGLVHDKDAVGPEDGAPVQARVHGVRQQEVVIADLEQIFLGHCILQETFVSTASIAVTDAGHGYLPAVVSAQMPDLIHVQAGSELQQCFRIFSVFLLKVNRPQPFLQAFVADISALSLADHRSHGLRKIPGLDKQL